MRTCDRTGFEATEALKNRKIECGKGSGVRARRLHGDLDDSISRSTKYSTLEGYTDQVHAGGVEGSIACYGHGVNC
jgi:hypothetical protein